MRQNMNILGLHPVWAWGRAHLGDFSDQFAQMTLNGVNIKGAELDVYPKKIRLTLGGGQTRRAVEGYELDQSFAQYLYAARIGYGDPKNNYFDLHVLKVKDDAGSLPEAAQGWDYPVVNPDTLQAEEDTLWIDKSYTQIRIKPQENLVAGCVAHVRLPQDIHLSMEASVSAYTQDLHAETVPLDSVEMPDFVRSIMDQVYTPRHSTYGDYALNSNLEMGFFGAQTQVGYRYIGPGYISLGTPSTLNDRQEMRFRTAYKWRSHRIRLNYTHFSDNLLDQKIATNSRHQIRMGVNSMLGRWRSGVQVNGLLLGNDASLDSLAYHFNTWILSTHQALTFGPESRIRQIGLQYTFQQSRKEKWLQDTDALYNTLNLTGQFLVFRNMNADISAGLSFRNSESGEKSTTQVYSARLSHRMVDNRLLTSIFSSSSLIRDTRMLRTGLMASYRLTGRVQLHLNLSSHVFRGPREFEEIRASVRISHRF